MKKLKPTEINIHKADLQLLLDSYEKYITATFSTWYLLCAAILWAFFSVDLLSVELIALGLTGFIVGTKLNCISGGKKVSSDSIVAQCRIAKKE